MSRNVARKRQSVSFALVPDKLDFMRSTCHALTEVPRDWQDTLSTLQILSGLLDAARDEFDAADASGDKIGRTDAFAKIQNIAEKIDVLIATQNKLN